MTLGKKISQGTLQGTLLCSEASSTLLNGAINNNKAIIFLFFIWGYGSIFGPWQAHIQFYFFFYWCQAFYFRLSVLIQLYQRNKKYLTNSTVDKTEPKHKPEWLFHGWQQSMPYHHSRSNKSKNFTVCNLWMLCIIECFCVFGATCI